MKIHDLAPAPGSTKARRRVGRGIAGKGGKTAGRGTKGLGARDTMRPGFEGGQLPLSQRIPKLKGFKNPFRVEYTVVNLEALEHMEASEVNPETLREVGLVHKKGLLKIPGDAQLTRRLTFPPTPFLPAGPIQAAGGSVQVIPPPFGHGRPPAKGNASQAGSGNDRTDD